MKVTVEKPVIKTHAFPRLMQYTTDKMVMLVTCIDDNGMDGTILDCGSDTVHEIGDTFKGWTTEDLEDFTAAITLVN
jgi:hypothetical protein